MGKLLRVLMPLAILTLSLAPARADYYEILDESPATKLWVTTPWPDREDANGDGIPDLTIQQILDDGSLARFRTYTAPDFTAYWEYEFPIESFAPSFYGFYDVDADGDREAFLRRYIASDPVPYSELQAIDTYTGAVEFRISYMYEVPEFVDYNGDGYPDVAAKVFDPDTEDNRVEVWSGMPASMTDSDRRSDVGQRHMRAFVPGDGATQPQGADSRHYYQVFESPPADGVQATILWPDAQDANGDGVPDVTLGQSIDSWNERLRTYTAPEFDLYWDYAFNNGNHAATFHGFLDADADGDKEACLVRRISNPPNYYWGLEVIDTQTGDIEFELTGVGYVYFADYNGDSYPEIVVMRSHGGDGHVEVWSCAARLAGTPDPGRDGASSLAETEGR